MHRLAQSGVPLEESPKGGVMILHNSNSSVVFDVNSKHHLDTILMELKESVLNKSIETFSQREDGVLRHQGRLFLPDLDELREIILKEAHGYQYCIYPRTTKMYNDLHEIYWWIGFK